MRVLESKLFWSTVAGLLLLYGCAHAGVESRVEGKYDRGEQLLGFLYSSGGEAATGFEIRVFRDGEMTLRCPGRRRVSRRLEREKLEELRRAIGDPELATELARHDALTRDACCELPEVLMEVGVSRSDYRIVLLQRSRLSPKVADLFRWIRSIAREEFRRDLEADFGFPKMSRPE